MLVPHRFDRVQAHADLVVGVVFVLVSALCLSVFVCWLLLVGRSRRTRHDFSKRLELPSVRRP